MLKYSELDSMRSQVKLPRMRAEVPCSCGIKVDFCVKKMPTGSERVTDTLAGATHCAGTAQVTGTMQGHYLSSTHMCLQTPQDGMRSTGPAPLSLVTEVFNCMQRAAAPPESGNSVPCTHGKAGKQPVIPALGIETLFWSLQDLACKG